MADVKVDIDAEVTRLAKKNGIPAENLPKPMKPMTIRDFLVESIRQYYRGKDDGYRDAIVETSRKLPAWALIAIGAAIPVLMKFGYKLALFCWHVYSA